MGALVTWGIDEQAVRKTVYYEGSSTIYEGMPVCYNWDTTTNWTGVQNANGTFTETTTTAEGYQNEGKFIRVENVSATNINAFAGVVANGPGVGLTGPQTVEIYIPNGAIVPVRTNLSTTVGVTPLAINTAEQALTSPHAAGQIVAIAWETVDRSSTNGLCLAKLDRNLTLQGRMGSSALNIGTADATSTMILNNITVTEAQTGGTFVPLYVHHTSTGNASTTLNETNILSYMNLSGTYDEAGYNRNVLAQLNLSGTLNSGGAHFYPLMAQLSGTPTATEVGHVAGISVDLSLGANPTTGNYTGILIANNGANQTQADSAVTVYGNYGINRLFDFQSCDGITANFVSNGGTGDTTLKTGDDWKKIKIRIGATDYYLIAMNEPTES